MSMAALPEKAGAVVSKQAISKYEKGLINPSSDVLIELARALDVKVDYFFRPARFAITGLEFRKKSMLTKKIEEQIKYQTLDFLQKYLEIEDVLNLQIKFDNPVSQPKIRTWADINMVFFQKLDFFSFLDLNLLP